MISLQKWKILTTLQKLLKNVEDLGKLIGVKGFKVAQSPINRPFWSHCSWSQSGCLASRQQLETLFHLNMLPT